jgi:hypothetical protein
LVTSVSRATAGRLNNKALIPDIGKDISLHHHV